MNSSALTPPAAREVTAESASIVVDSGGEVVLGRVLKGSMEQTKGKGSIRILARGAE